MTVILPLLIVASFCTSCYDESEKIATKEIDIKETNSTTINESNTTNIDEGIIDEFSIIESSVSKEEENLVYNIRFPQVDGLDDVDKQIQINELIKNEALKVLSYFKESLGDVEIDIDYDVTLKTPRIISIQYYGMGMVSETAHPNKLFYTANIDLVDEVKLRLSDIISIDSDFTHKFINGEFTPMWLEQSERIDLSEFTVDELISDFTNADSFAYVGSEMQSDVFSYLTEDSLGISIPVSHVIGGHAEYEIEYQHIQDNLVVKVLGE